MVDVLEIDVVSGERVERDFTGDESAHRVTLQAEEEARIQAEAAREAAKASALAKLQALGLTEDEAAALIS